MPRSATVVFFAVLLTVCSIGAAQRIAIPAGFPDAASTGYNGTLTDSAAITVTVDGTVVENLRVTGGINIQANDVTVRNCEVIGGGAYGIQATWGHTGIVIEDCVIDGQGHTGKGLYISGVTVRRCEIKDYQDGIVYKGTVTVEDCWMHSLYPSTGSHNDGIQTSGDALNCVFRHNTIQALYQDQTACLINQASTGPVNGLTIDSNFLSGGTYSVYVENRGHSDPQNVVLINNVFEEDGWAHGPYAGISSVTWIGNVYHTGVRMPQNPAIANHLPVANAGDDQTATDTDDSGDESIMLDGSYSYDIAGSIVSYNWVEGATPLATGSEPSVLLGVGVHTVALTVTDAAGATDTDTVSITVLAAPPNVAPVADAGPNQIVIDTDDSGDQLVTLSGAGSSDCDGAIASYVWEKDAAQIATGSNPSVMMTVGEHTVTLTVTDDDGATDTDTVVITVNVSGDTSPTVTYQVAASADDTLAGRYADSPTSAYVYFPDASGSFSGYIRWALDIPAGVRVTDAHVSLCAYSDFSTSPTVRMQLLDDDDCPDFSSSPYSWSVTSSYVDWTMTSWTMNQWYDSPDMASLVQEFIDRPGYGPGSYLGLRGHQESGSDLRRARSYDSGGNAHGPKLVVTYTFDDTSIAGDADGDGDVDLDDFVILKTTFGASPLVDDRADFDGDGDVDLDDFVTLKTNFGT